MSVFHDPYQFFDCGKHDKIYFNEICFFWQTDAWDFHPTYSLLISAFGFFIIFFSNIHE